MRIICLILTLSVLLTTGALADQEAQAQLEREIGAYEIGLRAGVHRCDQRCRGQLGY